jgi:hypothetical protein
MLFAAVLLALPVSAQAAESCRDEQESCLENCHVDHGMESDRVKLTKCVKHCDDRFDDCQDLRQEEKRSQVALEPAPQERKAGSDPSDVRPVKDERATDVSPAPPEDDPADPKSKSRKSKVSSQEDDPPAVEKKPKPEDDPPPPKRAPPRKSKDDEPKNRRGGDDDWAK